MSRSDIISAVSQRFNNALDNGSLFFFPSIVIKHIDLGVEFEIRLCPALQNKPRLPTPDLESNPAADTDPAVHDGKLKTYDPFAPPYNPDLYVGGLCDDSGEEYAVLLNKYAVVSHHFLLVTKEFRSQSSPLMPSDLVQTYLLLVAAKKAGQNLFAFYNCGDNSGASQPHKHVQFIPVEEDGPPVEHLARSVHLEIPDKPFSLSKLPYANHVCRFPPQLSSYTPDKLETTLSASFLLLLDLGISTIRHDPAYPPGKPSYNVFMTLEHIHLIPRRQETYLLSETGETLSINSLGFAGMLLVKSEKELEALKKERIGKVLRAVGLESVHDLQIAGTAAEGE